MDQTDRVLVRLLPAAGVLLLVLLLLCVAIDTLRPLQEYDIWLHLTSGEHIVRNRAIPTHDPYSFSAFGRPWVYHEWLFAVAVYGLYVVGGITALNLLQAGLMALLAAMVAALMLQLQPPSPWKLPGTVLWLLAGYFLLLPRFHLRPHQLSLLFLTLELFVLYRGGRWRWLLPPLFVFWANIHGDVIAGVALLGLWGWCRAIDGPRKGGRWLLAAGGALLLTLCNPYGWRLWQMAWRVGTFSEYQRYIYEWMPLRPEAYERITPALIMIALAAVMTAGRRRWFELALATFGVVAMLKAMRYTPLACIFATPLVAVALRAAAERWMARRWRAYGALAAAALAVLLFAHTQVGQSSGFGYKARVFPFPAFTFIRQHALHGRTFADYAYATAYSTCNLPGNPYYIDGRWDVFGEEIFRRFRATKEGRDWRALLDGERVDVVLLAAQPYDYAHERFPPLAAALSATAEWQLAFWDDISLVFIRRAAFPGFTAGYDRAWPVVAEAGKRDVPASGNIAAIVAQAQAGSPYGIWACQTGARLAQAAGDTQQAQEWYQQGLGQMPENAVLLTEYGQFLSDNGMETPALLAWELATSVAADYYLPYYLLGRHYQSPQLLARAVALQPRFGEARLALAYEYMRRRDPDRAHEVIEDAPHDDLQFALLRAGFWQQQGDFARAIPPLRQYLAHYPQDHAAWMALATCHIRLKQLAEAGEIFVRLETAGESSPVLYADHGALLLEQGEWARAKQLLDRALAMRPDMAPALHNRQLVSRQLGEPEYVAPVVRAVDDTGALRLYAQP